MKAISKHPTKLGIGLLAAAGLLVAAAAVPVVTSTPTFAKYPKMIKGHGYKRIKGRVSRGKVDKACRKSGGIAHSTAKGAKGDYGCINTKSGSAIYCNKKGKCVGTSGDKKQPQ